MIATIIVGLFSVLFAYFAKYKNIHWGLKVSFSLIFLFLALRYNFGNDYKGYLDAFIEIKQYSQIDLFDKTQHFEPGWILLNWLFRRFGFFVMTAVLALLNCVVYYRFIKKYVPVKYYWLATFLYIFNPEFMLIHSSAMRQSVAIMLFVFSIDYLYKKNVIGYFLCIGLASLFHISSLILLPVYLLGLFNWKINKVSRATYILVFTLLIIYAKSISPYLNEFISKYFEKYTVYQDPGIVNTGLGFIYLSVIFIYALYYERLQNKETALIFKIAIMSFMIMPFTLVINLITRVGMYFTPATLAAYTIILKNIKRPITKTIFMTLLLVFVTYKFFLFFHSDVWKDHFGTYQTIFSASQWY